MRAKEFINQDLEEGWKEKAIGATVLGATTAGLLGPGIAKNLGHQPGSTTQHQTAIKRQYIQRTPKIDQRIDFKNQEPQSTAQQQPHARPSVSKVPSIKLTLPKKFNPQVLRKTLEKAAVQHGINGNELAMLMARAGHETAGFTSLEEKGTVEYFFNRYDKDGANPDKAKILGNTKELDGINFRGGAHLHITGRYNTEMVQNELNSWSKYRHRKLDLVNHPEILRHNPEIAADASVAFWKLRVAPALKGKQANIKTASAKVNPAGRGALDTFKRFAQELIHYTPAKTHKKSQHKK